MQRPPLLTGGGIMTKLYLALALTFAVAVGTAAVITIQTQPAHAQCGSPRC
jgi:hypothetical protein